MNFRMPAMLKILVACVLVLPWGYVAANPASETVVVVHQEVSETELSLGTVRTIFGMRLHTWGDGTPIEVYVLADDHPAHIDFSKQVLGMFPQQLRWAWDRLVYSGTGQTPITVTTEEEMKQRIANSPGAIGYLRRGYVDGSIHILPVR